MHQLFTHHGLSSFFEPLIDCDIADGVDVAQLDHLVRQKAQRLAGVSLGRITAGKCDETDEVDVLTAFP